MEVADSAAGALVIGGAHGALAVARSLGRRGVPVWFLTDDHPLAHYSRYVSRNLGWDGPSDVRAVDFLLRLADQHRLNGWTLFACGDAEVRLVSQNHAALSDAFRLTTPRWETAQWCLDKRMTHQLAAGAGVDSPWSFYPADLEEVTRLDFRFPVIVKPTRREQRNAFTQAKAWRADDRASLIARYREASALVGERMIVIQEFIPGGGAQQFSYAALCENGAPLASLVARRTRQFPIDFGYTSTLVESVEQSDVEHAASQVLRALNYTGLVEIEFKYDVRDGRHKLLDINARPWTWIGLGTAAGVDFALLAWRLAAGESVPPVRAQVGARWMHVSRDFAAAWQEWRAGSGSLLGPLRALHPPLTFATFALDDPLPAAMELPIVAARLLARRWVERRQPSIKRTAVSPRPML